MPNTAPVFTTTPPQTATISTPFTYQARALDSEGQAVSFGLLSAPEGMRINAATGLVEWTPPANVAALTPVVIEAFDTRGAVSLQRFVLAITGGNRAPEFAALPGAVSGGEGQLFEFELVATDPENTPLTYWVDGLPAGASFDPATRLFSWLADYQSAGTYDVRFFVSDGTSRDEAVVTLLVAERNEPPQVTVPADRVAREGDFIRFTIDAKAQSDRILTFGSDSLPFGATINPGTGEFIWTPSFIQNGVYEIPFYVTDDETLVRFVTKITVTNANAAPVFDQQDGWQVLEGQQLAFNVFAFDPDNPYYTPAIRNTQSGAATETSELPRTVNVAVIGDLPPGATFDPVTFDFSWTPGNAQAGEYVVRFRATDTGDGGEPPLSAEISVPLRVFNQNRRPVVQPIANATVAKDAVLEIPVSASDADGNPLVLRR